MTLTKSARFLSIAIISAFALVLVLPTGAQAATTCGFTRNLEVGDEGQDVLCLQKFLNSSGFPIASAGVGSAGRETTQFKDLTKQALVKWQTSKGILPATGYFGAQSRAKYAAVASVAPATPGAVLGASTDTGNASLVVSLTSQISSLTSELNALKANPTPSSSGEQKKATTAIKEALGEHADEAREYGAENSEREGEKRHAFSITSRDYWQSRSALDCRSATDEVATPPTLSTQ